MLNGTGISLISNRKPTCGRTTRELDRAVAARCSVLIKAREQGKAVPFYNSGIKISRQQSPRSAALL